MRTGVWLVGLAFALGIGVSAVPTPLYTLYAARDGFGSGTVTLVFAAFSASVSVTLVLAGTVSDRVGRRRTLIPALLLDGVSCVIFILWPALPGLIIARSMCGVSVGAIAATATTYMGELHDRAGPRRMVPRPELVATAANLGGVGVGALAAGLAAQYGPHPLALTYEVYLGLLALVAAGVAFLPEPAAAASAVPAIPADRIGVRRRRAAPASGDDPAPGATADAGHGRYAAAAAGALVAMTTLGLFASLVPSFLSETLHQHSRALAGAMACVAFVSAALAQMLLGRLSPRRALVGGYAAMATGLALMTAGVWTQQLALFVASGVAAGAGAGLVFKRCLAIAAEPAAGRSRAGSLAGLYLAAYLGLALAIVGLGVSTDFVSDRVALLVFAAVACAAIGGLASARARPAAAAPFGS